MKKFWSKFVVGILSLTMMISLSPKVDAIYLIDNIDEMKSSIETFAFGPMFGNLSSDGKTEYEIVHPEGNEEKELIKITKWQGYSLLDNYKYLLSSNAIHIFTIKDKYVSSIIFYDMKETNEVKIEARYIPELEKEAEEYKSSGFSQMPMYHVTTIKDNISYLNQLENPIYPNITCAPTSIAMKLQIDGYKFLDEAPQEVADISTNIVKNTESKITYKDYLSSFKEELKNSGGMRSNNCINWLIDKGIVKPGTSTLTGISKITLAEQILYKPTPWIACIKQLTTYFRYGTGRFYSYNWNNQEGLYHSINITGFYQMTNGEVGYEIYDPFSELNKAGIPSGKGVFAKAEDLLKLLDSDSFNLQCFDLNLEGNELSVDDTVV